MYLHDKRKANMAKMRNVMMLLGLLILVLAGASYLLETAVAQTLQHRVYLPMIVNDKTGDTGGTIAFGPIHTGIATYYDATGEGNCVFPATPNDLMVAAINSVEYENVPLVANTSIEIPMEADGLYKSERVITSPQGAEVSVNGEDEVVIMCANNYLGLSSHPEVIKAAKDTLDTHGFGMSSVRFICGTQDIHKELEAKIAKFYGTEDTILYAAAFDANGGVFEPLFDENDVLLAYQAEPEFIGKVPFM